ncbi:MAG: cyclase family protein, partial [Planctomycetes bacterium]|nr:cyclase family protein [Planctomycetota bacterium]
RDPRLYVGPCEVMRVEVGRGERIARLPRSPRHPRVLLHTGTFPDPDDFSMDFAALSVPLVEELAAAGVRLVGIDTPSVDLCHDKELLAHHAIAAHDLAILEGLVLAEVPEGEYTLLAQPLPLDADASPVRALLLTQLIEELL